MISGGRVECGIGRGYQPRENETLGRPYGSTIQVDAMGNFRPIKDLVVDMEPFWEKFRAVKPFLIPDGPPPERERIVPKEAM